MDQGPSWQANTHSASQGIPRLLWNPKVLYRVRKDLTPISILNQRHPVHTFPPYEGASKSFRTGLVRELQMVELSATRCSCIAILWVGLVSFDAITLCVASQRVFIVVYFVMNHSGNFWIHPRTSLRSIRILSSNLRVDLRSYLFFSGFATKILYVSHHSHAC
jgi:hypothetical protein